MAWVFVPGVDPLADVGFQSVTLRCAGRRSLRLVSSANHRSTRLIHDQLVGGEVHVEPGMTQQTLLDRRGLAGGVDVTGQVQL
jgi:hypothetical protein